MRSDLVEKVEPRQLEILSAELDSAGGKGLFTSSDLKKIIRYFDRHGATSVMLSPEVFGAFLRFAKEIGFPATVGAAKMALHTSLADTKSMIIALKGAKVLTSMEVPGGSVSKLVNRDWKEDQQIKKNPAKEIEIFDYDPDFVQELGLIVGKLGLKSESKELAMNPILLEMKNLLKKMKIESSEPEDSSHEDEGNFFHHLDQDAVEKFADGLLLVLGELEAEGKIPKFDKASDARAALMATIRKLYQSRSSVGKMARKYQRFGSQRVLRAARRDISRAQMHKSK